MCNENPASNDANGDIDLSPDLVVFLKIFCRIMLAMPVYKTPFYRAGGQIYSCCRIGRESYVASKPLSSHSDKHACIAESKKITKQILLRAAAAHWNTVKEIKARKLPRNK